MRRMAALMPSLVYMTSVANVRMWRARRQLRGLAARILSPAGRCGGALRPTREAMRAWCSERPPDEVTTLLTAGQETAAVRLSTPAETNGGSSPRSFSSSGGGQGHEVLFADGLRHGRPPHVAA